MTWKSDIDCFKFNCSFTAEWEEKVTRRRILSVYSRIFDPLGFIQPFIFKLIIQELSRLKLLWDDEIPDSLIKDWLIWLSEITGISMYEFPRCIIKDVNFVSAELHIFADSSRELKVWVVTQWENDVLKTSILARTWVWNQLDKFKTSFLVLNWCHFGTRLTQNKKYEFCTNGTSLEPVTGAKLILIGTTKYQV